MVRPKITLAFAATGTNKSGKIYENGIIRAIVMVVPNFTNAITVTQIDVIDDDGDTIYTNTTGWAENATHLITGLTIPVDKEYQVKVTVSGVAGGSGGDVAVKPYIETVK